MRHTKGQLVYNAGRVFIDKHRRETTESYHDNDRLDLHRRSPVDRVRAPRQDRRKRKIQSCSGKCLDTIDRNHLRLRCNRIRQYLNIENKRRSIILKLWIKLHTSRQKEDLHGEESEPSHVFQSSVSMYPSGQAQ